MRAPPCDVTGSSLAHAQPCSTLNMVVHGDPNKGRANSWVVAFSGLGCREAGLCRLGYSGSSVAIGSL